MARDATDNALADAVDDAMWPALMEAAERAVLDAIEDKNLTTDQGVLKHAIFNAADMLVAAWGDFGDAACDALDGGSGTRRGPSLDDLRTLTRGLTRAVDVLLARALGEEDE